MNRTRLVLGMTALTVALAACKTVGPNYKLPADSHYAHQQEKPMVLDTGGSDAVDTTDAAVDRWWELYNDPVLNGLVKQALDSNVELRVATARLEKATAAYQYQAAQGGFDGSVDASVSRAQISAESLLQTEKLAVFNLGSGGLSVSYTTDLFGKLRRATEASKADAQSVLAARDLARISVAAQVVGSYVETCHLNHEIHIAEHSIELQQRTKEVAQRMYAAGRGTSTVVDRAGSQVASLQATLPPLRARKQASEYELAELLGQTPDKIPAGVDQCADAPELTRAIPVGDGGALLRRRPDVRQAERELHAATAEIGVATAELYPDITIGASAGANGLLADFGNSLTREWSLGPAIHWTIPGKGARARVRVAEFGQKVALGEFDQVVLNALKETQTILSTYVQDLQRVRSLREALEQAERAADEDRRLYQAGRRPYLVSLDADRTRVSSETALADAESLVSQDQVKLFLALGGGWQQQPAAAATAPAAPASTPAPAAQ